MDIATIDAQGYIIYSPQCTHYLSIEHAFLERMLDYIIMGVYEAVYIMYRREV